MTSHSLKSAFGAALAVAFMAACSPTVVPPPERGIGFDDPTERALREAQLSAPRGTIIPAPQVTSIAGAPPQGIGANELASAGIGQGVNTGGANLGSDPLRTQGIDASPSNPAPQLATLNGLSDEQNFDAVSERETIESDAQRRAAQAALRQQIDPTALPDRPANVGPNIVEYALNAPNARGQEWYSRTLLSGEGRFRRNCAAYLTPDDAQRDFLARGGPERDPRGLDPDGDGFACGWDPAPFIAAFRN